MNFLSPFPRAGHCQGTMSDVIFFFLSEFPCCKAQCSSQIKKKETKGSEDRFYIIKWEENVKQVYKSLNFFHKNYSDKVL